MWTVRARLTAGVLALISVLVLSLSIIEIARLRSLLVDSEATRLRAQAKTFVDIAAGTPFDPGNAAALATNLTSADTGAVVLTPAGEVLAGPRPGTVGAAPPTDVPLAAVTRAAAGDKEVDVVRDVPAGRELLALVPEPGGRPTRAVVVLATSLADEDAALFDRLLVALVGLAAALALAAVGSLVLVRRSLRPLRRIADTAALVAAGDLGRRVRWQGPRDEIGRLAEAFDAMTATLQENFAQLERSEYRSRAFVADASHELRTPLTTLAGFTDVLLRRVGHADVDAARLLAALRREVDRMQRVVSDLLLLAQSDEGLQTRRESVDLRVAVRRAVDQVRPLAGDRCLEVDGDGVLAASDPDRVHQILLNLLGNAVQHTRSDGTITVQLVDGGDLAQLTVRDDGTGMDERTRAEAFERFRRGSDRTGPGAGLGLAIVAALVEALDGAVGIESSPGSGTAVQVRLPRAGSGRAASGK